MHLKEHLDRLNVLEESPTFGDREKLLDGFVKQGYLHRAKVGDEARGNNDNVWEYYWGPRARAEIIDSNIVDFITSVSYEMSISIFLIHTCYCSFSKVPTSRIFQPTSSKLQGKTRSSLCIKHATDMILSLQCH